ncbi:MAG: alanine racemase [Candidatus Omnitrophota bacterium]|jgi:alanine racemase
MSNLIGYRPTWAEVDLRNLAHNFLLVRKSLSPKTRVLVTVKADAYGHGLLPVARALSARGVDYLGVASIDEGIQLREGGISSPVLLLGMILKQDIPPLFEYNITPAICTAEVAIALNNMARRLSRPINVHIKVDTGMGRVGVLYKDAYRFFKKIHDLKFVYIEGLFTHLACADVNNSFTLYQIGLMEELIRRLSEDGIRIAWMHAANSLGLLQYKKSHFNMVRPGLIIYGLYPRERMDIALRPVLSLKTRIVYAKKVPAGYGISYGHTYVTRRTTNIATLPLGYGDGYPRNLSNQGPVLIRGRRFRISGRVCMDQILVDTGDLRVDLGEEAVLIGSQGKNRITAEELAGLAGTIPYEIVCGLGSRIPRVYR